MPWRVGAPVGNGVCMRQFVATAAIVNGRSSEPFENPPTYRLLIGEMLASQDIELPQQVSNQQLLKSITSESHVFSIYSTGRVGAGKRVTQRRIHAVVDMRGAPPPWEKPQVVVNPEQPDALPVAVRPGGQIIYYRID